METHEKLRYTLARLRAQAIGEILTHLHTRGGQPVSVSVALIGLYDDGLRYGVTFNAHTLDGVTVTGITSDTGDRVQFNLHELETASLIDLLDNLNA